MENPKQNVIEIWDKEINSQKYEWLRLLKNDNLFVRIDDNSTLTKVPSGYKSINEKELFCFRDIVISTRRLSINGSCLRWENIDHINCYEYKMCVVKSNGTGYIFESTAFSQSPSFNISSFTALCIAVLECFHHNNTSYNYNSHNRLTLYKYKEPIIEIKKEPEITKCPQCGSADWKFSSSTGLKVAKVVTQCVGVIGDTLFQFGIQKGIETISGGLFKNAKVGDLG